MLDEYLALGGVELGNNQRAYAYAQCLSCCTGLLKCPGCSGIHDATNPWTDAQYEWLMQAVNLATNPSMETAGAAVAVRTNLATNPSFEAATAATVEVRRNLINDPQVVVGGNWNSGGLTGATREINQTLPAGAWAGATKGLEATWAAAGPASYNAWYGDIPAVAGERISGSYYVQPSWTGAKFAVTFECRNSSGGTVTYLGSIAVAVPANAPTRISVLDILLPAGTASVRIFLDSQGGTPAPAGGTLYASAFLTEKSPVLGTYFDGSTLPAGDFAHAWTGTANASASVQYGTLAPVPIPNGSPNNVAAVLSSEWAASGGKSVRLIPDGVTTDSFYQLGGYNFSNFQRGKTYTVMGTLRLAAPQAGSIYGMARKLVAISDGPGFVAAEVQAPNVAGVYPLRITFTAPASGGSYMLVRLYNGVSKGNGDVWWDDLLIVEGTYTGPYFDGSTPAKVRRNLAPNPSQETSNGFWGDMTGGLTKTISTEQAFSGTHSLKIARDADGYRGVAINGSRPKVTGGETITASAYVWSSVPTSARAGIDWRLSDGTSGNGPMANGEEVAVPARTWTRVSVTGVAPVSAPAGTIAEAEPNWGFTSGLTSADDAFLDAVLVEKSATLGTFFDGATAMANGTLVAGWEGTPHESPSYLTDPDFTYAWTGTAHASTSTQKAPEVAGVVGMWRGWLIAPSALGGLRLMSGGFTSTTLLQGMMRGLPLKEGTQYTILARVRNITSKALTRLRLGALRRTTEGTGGTGFTEFPLAVGEVADFRYSYTTSVGGSGDWYVAIGAEEGIAEGESILWEQFLIVEGTYVGPYFDGSTLPAGADPAISRVAWTGAADASTSTYEQYLLTVPAASTGEPPYDCSALSFAPWYDASNPASQRLAGFYLLSVQGVTDSTMTAPTSEGLDDGGVIGSQRNALRTVRVRTLIVGCGMDAAEYGLAWLKAALSTSFCGRHGDACGTSDLDFFIDCPPALDPSDPDYGASTTRYRRFLHGVGATSGPVLAEQYETTSGAYVMIVDYILTAESPFVWGETLDIANSGQTLTAYDDIPFNLMRYPSGEVGDGVPAVVATQYAFNGSVEFGAAGWAYYDGGIGVAVSAGATTDIAAVGPNSYRVRLLATGAVVDKSILAYYDVPLAGVPAGAKPSVSIWGAALIFAGAPTMDSLQGIVEWRSASAAISQVTIGTLAINGGNSLAKGLAVPAGATTARLILQAVNVDAVAGDDLRIYADAFALTVP